VSVENRQDFFRRELVAFRRFVNCKKEMFHTLMICNDLCVIEFQLQKVKKKLINRVTSYVFRREIV
jgi:hypothetical protein